MGRFAVLADPQGATFAVYTPPGPPPEGSSANPADRANSIGTSSPRRTTPRRWTSMSSCSVGRKARLTTWAAMGIYQIINQGGAQVGGIYNLTRAFDAAALAELRGSGRLREGDRRRQGCGRAGPERADGSAGRKLDHHADGSAGRRIRRGRAAERRRRSRRPRRRSRRPLPRPTRRPRRRHQPAAPEPEAGKRSQQVKPPRRRVRHAAKKAPAKKAVAKKAAKKAAAKKGC